MSSIRFATIGSRRRLGAVPWLAVGGMMILAATSLFLGYLAALGVPMLVLPFIGLGGIVILMAVPPVWLAAGTYFLTFFVVGTTVYFTRLEKLNWLPYLMGMVMILHVVGLLLSDRRASRTSMPSFVWATLAYLLAFAVSAVAAEITAGQLVIALKNYVFLWAALFLFLYGVRNPVVFERFWNGVLFLVVAQVPVSIYQYVIVGGRQKEQTGVQSWDAVSGTFGGSEVGGASGAMAIMMVVGILLAAALYRSGRLRRHWAILVILSALVAIALAEVKAALVIFLPLGVMYFFRREMRRRPIEFLAVITFLAVVIVAIGWAYQKLHYSDAGYEHSTSEKIEEAMSRELDPKFVSLVTGEMGRVAVLVYWWSENGANNPLQTFVGYGPGATRVSSFYLGDLVLRYPYFRLDRTAASILLWDTGILGFVTILAILWTGWRHSERLARDEQIPEIHRILLNISSATLVLLTVSVFYTPDMVGNAHFQLLVTLCLGQAGYWYRRRQLESCSPAHSPKSGKISGEKPLARPAVRWNDVRGVDFRIGH